MIIACYPMVDTSMIVTTPWLPSVGSAGSPAGGEEVPALGL